MQKPLGGHPLRSVIFGSIFMQQPLGGHPLRSVILGFAFLQNLTGGSLAICDFGSHLMQNLSGDTPCDL